MQILLLIPLCKMIAAVLDCSLLPCCCRYLQFKLCDGLVVRAISGVTNRYTTHYILVLLD